MHSLVAAVGWNIATKGLIRLEKAHMDRCVLRSCTLALQVRCDSSVADCLMVTAEGCCLYCRCILPRILRPAS